MMVNATSVAKNERWIRGVAHSLAPPVELTGGAARLPAVGAKNWPFGTLVAAELVLPPREEIKGVELKERGAQGYNVVVK
eukprot:scaffold64472_cov45-Phaeocystis_antarctica.AAC.1